MTEQTSTVKKTSEVDVSFGQPLYMLEYWTLLDKISTDSTIIHLNEGMSYNFGHISPRLEVSIRTLHNMIGNAAQSQCEVVVGNGASQLVSAIAYATQKMDIYQILLEPPYWGRLKFLLNLGAGAVGNRPDVVRKHKALINDKYFKFAVNPNNPDNKQSEPEGELSVADMCYYWPQYVKNIEMKSYDVMIFGLGKATGHAGVRIGWALVKNPRVAELMREFVHQSTCGVSKDSQKRAVTILNKVVKPSEVPEITCFDFAKEKLKNRWWAFRAAVRGKFAVENDSGMFAWCRGEVPAGLKVMSAESSGISDNSYFRINLGCDDETFAAMLKVISGS